MTAPTAETSAGATQTTRTVKMPRDVASPPMYTYMHESSFFVGEVTLAQSTATAPGSSKGPRFRATGANKAGCNLHIQRRKAEDLTTCALPLGQCGLPQRLAVVPVAVSRLLTLGLACETTPFEDKLWPARGIGSAPGRRRLWPGRPSRHHLLCVASCQNPQFS